MRVNVDKVLERDQKLSELDDRADALQAGASQFESSAAKLKNKYWWKNCKVGGFREGETESKRVCVFLPVCSASQVLPQCIYPASLQVVPNNSS